ncbi:MAG: hypothetical protein QOI25_5612, partial [Mycobacterium sp.]|nr:hypothetical protein [Mycobacterium sp.]
MLTVTGVSTLLLTGAVGNGVAAVPPQLAVSNITPAAGDLVGVAMPVTVTFAGPVANRAAAERAISFSSPKTPAGTFTWLADDAVQFTPTGFWPAHSTISVSVGGAKTSFGTNAAVVGVADIDAHT